MAAKKTNKSSVGLKSVHVATNKKTTIGRNHAMIGFGTMNKSKRASYKKYRGQGR